MTARQIIGMILLAAALMSGVAELWLSAVSSYGAADITVGHLWFLISARSLSIVQGLITDHLWSPIWNIGISPLLVAPAWSFFGVSGALLLFLGRPKTARR